MFFNIKSQIIRLKKYLLRQRVLPAIEIIFLVFIFFLIGCLDVEQETHLNSNGSGYIKVHISENKQIKEKHQQELWESISLDKHVKPEEIDSYVEKMSQFINHKPEEYLKILNFGAISDTEAKMIEKDGIKHVYLTAYFDDITKTYTNKREIEFSKNENGNKLYKEYIFIPESFQTTIQKDETNHHNIEIALGTFKYTLYVPGKIIDSNADEVDANKAVWNFSKKYFWPRKDFSGNIYYHSDIAIYVEFWDFEEE